MDTEEVDTASTPKKQKVELGQQLVQTKKGHEKKNNLLKVQQQEEPKVTKLQIQEYVFDGQTLSKHASKHEWVRSY